jgi:hypothetical protein
MLGKVILSATCAADVIADVNVDTLDFLDLLSNWGPCQ